MDTKITSPLRSDHAALSLHWVTLGTDNKRYTSLGWARPSPKFFFRHTSEKTSKQARGTHLGSCIMKKMKENKTAVIQELLKI